MAVVAIIAIGEGAKKETLNQIERMGVSNIYIRADQLTDEQQQRARLHHSAGLQDSDRYRLVKSIPLIKATASSRELILDLAGFPANMSPKVIACSPGYGDILGISMMKGRFVSDLDTQDRKLVCVLGWQVARQLGNAGNLGSLLHIDNDLFQVVGILARQDSLQASETKLSLQDFNETIFLPLGTTASVGSDQLGELSGVHPVTEIIVEVHRPEQVPAATAMIRRGMEAAHNGVDDFQLIVPLELLAKSRKIQRVFNVVLGIIGSISLVVGGIGIMNIMLANISERIKEIGLRRAVGARPIHITVQFLVEAAFLTFVGGLCGIVSGISLALLIGAFTHWPIRFSLPALFVPLLISVLVGLFFGLYPARKAAKMDPVTALGSNV